MRAQPEAMLASTGAISFGEQAEGQIHDLFQGTEPALIARYFATTMSWAQVYEWYKSWFAAHRWSPQTRFNLAPGRVSASQSYDNAPREQFTVGLESLLTIQLKAAASLKRDTLYQTLFSVDPYQSNCATESARGSRSTRPAAKTLRINRSACWKSQAGTMGAGDSDGGASSVRPMSAVKAGLQGSP